MVRTRRAVTAILLGGLVAYVPATAHAHAQLRQADPSVGGTVGTPPSQVDLTFSEAVEPRLSAIDVTDAAGHAVDTQDIHIPQADATHLAVSLRPLAAGTYTVRWRAISVDTHRTEGSFTFTVAP